MSHKLGRRRALLLAGSAVALAGAASVPVGVQVNPSGPPVSGLTATIVWQDGTQTVYAASAAVDMGDYVDPQGMFVQGSLLAIDPSKSNFRCWFRTNKSGVSGYFPYDSVVFEYGDLIEAAPVHLAPYSVTIQRDSTVLYTYTLPTNDNNVGHFWQSRWRWQSAPFPTNRMTRQQIVQQRFAPNGWNTAFTSALPKYSAFSYTPMTLAGTTAFQGQTGGRNDIGFYTAWTMAWLWGGDPAMLSTVMAQAECSGTWPIHWRTPKLQSPLDCTAYPNANTIKRAKGTSFNGSTFGPDIGHRPSLCFLPWLLTGDPYYLEELQMTAADDLISTPLAGRGDQTGRYYGWPLRNALKACKATPASVPSWLQSQANQQLNLNYYSDKMTAWANGTAKYAGVADRFAASVYHVTNAGGARSYADELKAGTYFVPWQESYIDMSHAMALIWGFPQFLVPFLWHLESNLTRANGTSGWPRAYDAMYQMAFMWGTATTVALDGVAPTPLINVELTDGAPQTGNFVIQIENEQFLVNTVPGVGFQVVTRGYNKTAIRSHVVKKEVYLTDTSLYYSTYAQAFAGNNLMWSSYGKAMTFAPGDTTGNDKIVWGGGGLGSSDYTGSHYFSLVLASGVPPEFFPAGKLDEVNACLAWFNTAIPEVQTRTKQAVPFAWVTTPW